jgi:hypothetical protein
MSDLRFLIIETIMVCGVFLLSRWARKNPDEPLTAVLFRLTFGPRTDVKYMTRSDLFRSAASFLTWALILAVVMLLLVMTGFSSGREPPAIYQMLVFGIAIGLAMSGLAAAYLFIRGALRSPTYKPPEKE